MKLPLPPSWYAPSTAPAQPATLFDCMMSLIMLKSLLFLCGPAAAIYVKSPAFQYEHCLQVTRLQNQSHGVFFRRIVRGCFVSNGTHYHQAPCSAICARSPSTLPASCVQHLTFPAQALLLSSVDKTVIPAIVNIMRVCRSLHFILLLCVTFSDNSQRLLPGASPIGSEEDNDKNFNEWLVLSRWSVRAPISAVVALFYSLSNQVSAPLPLPRHVFRLLHSLILRLMKRRCGCTVFKVKCFR